ncbi:tropinone reductase 2-like [Brachionus plicatilis]|uniref:Tropinone reductase 2-like n=1 Tax=Brachionus plicatilis TaxID=10195 RepID=A0A3M7RF55_BRAPC|nr:tropinone reductase 2-like [Brachionus plicatilis]
MLNLSGKTSIITGASSGIGKATAILFSKLGSNLVVLGRDEKGLDDTLSKCQSNVIKVVGDITDNEVRSQLIESCIAKFGKLTTLVNNAAIFKLSGIMNTDQSCSSSRYFSSLSTIKSSQVKT